MAKIKQGILGGFSGSVAGVVGTSWKGRAVMKAKPLSVANPKTEGQVSQRTSFKGVAQFASFLLTYVIRRLYNPIAGNISGYNYFTRQNKQMFDGTGAFVPANLKVGGGTLPTESINQLQSGLDTDNVIVQWNNSATAGSPRNDDIAVAFAYEPSTGTIFSTSEARKRSDESITLDIVKAGSDLIGVLQVTVGLAFISADGRLSSVEVPSYTSGVNFG